MHGTLLCGRHKRQVLAKVSNQIAGSGLAALAMFGDIGQTDLLHSAISELRNQKVETQAGFTPFLQDLAQPEEF